MYNNIGIANALKEGDALHVLVANNGTNAANLANWRLVTDNRNLTFTFPIFTLMPKTMVTIHTHKGNNTVSDLYGSNFMWNGTNEIKLLDANGKLVYDYRIGLHP
jgi:predicted metal-dependent enzyme (double-stranded beta helix superfamily)